MMRLGSNHFILLDMDSSEEAEKTSNQAPILPLYTLRIIYLMLNHGLILI
jgi:hypothetical protein